MFMEGIGSLLTVVDTVQQYPLGSLYAEPAVYSGEAASDEDVGPRVWRYVYNPGAALAAYIVVKKKAGVTKEHVVIADQAGPASKFTLRGVTQHAIGAASYGWILCHGVG